MTSQRRALHGNSGHSLPYRCGVLTPDCRMSRSGFRTSTIDEIALPATGRRRSKPTMRRVMGQLEPPSPTSRQRSHIFFIGKDSRGNWIVQDQQHLCGGLFVDRAEAFRFAMFENGHQPQAVVMVPGVFELDLTGKASAAHQRVDHADAPRARPVLEGLLSFPPVPKVVPV
jgi:hypothetical protein